MKVSLYTQGHIPFYGINEAIKKIQSQIENKIPPLGNDTFTPSQSSDKTVIIENYYESGQNKNGNSGFIGEPRNGSAAAEGAVSGVTTGSAIEGTKAVAQKIKNGKGEAATDTKESIDPDSNTPVDLSDNDEEISSSQDTKYTADNDMDNTDTNNETGNDTELEMDKPDTELEPDIDGTDIEPDTDIDVDTDVDIDTDIEPEFDIDDIDF